MYRIITPSGKTVIGRTNQTLNSTTTYKYTAIPQRHISLWAVNKQRPEHPKQASCISLPQRHSKQLMESTPVAKHNDEQSQTHHDTHSSHSLTSDSISLCERNQASFIRSDGLQQVMLTQKNFHARRISTAETTFPDVQHTDTDCGRCWTERLTH